MIEFHDVTRVYQNGEHMQNALDHVNLKLEEGKFIVILGPSGAEKSTMLNLWVSWIGQPAGNFRA